MDSHRSLSNDDDVECDQVLVGVVQNEASDNFHSNRSSTEEAHQSHQQMNHRSRGGAQSYQRGMVPASIDQQMIQMQQYKSENRGAEQRHIGYRQELHPMLDSFSGQKSSVVQQSPLPSQYNALVNKREGSANQRGGNQRWTASSNGFKQQPNPFQTLQPSMNVCSGLQTLDQHQLNSNICHVCSVHQRAQAYSSLVQNNSIVYSQNVPTLVNCNGSQQQKFIRLEIEVVKTQLQSQQQQNMKASQTASFKGQASNNNTEALHFTLSDDSNPLFLYLSTINVNKFLQIRKEQNIFVEFSNFADKVQALLDFCIANKDIGEDGNRFVCKLDSSVELADQLAANDNLSILDVFEHNDFRNLLHLRLEFIKATPEESSFWLAKKLLMQRKLNLDLHTENFELSEQHDQDRQRISQIKQSLLQLKQTQNDELQRIKDEHEAQLEAQELQKQRDLNDMKNNYQSQMQDLTTEFEERLSEIKRDAESLRAELSRTQSQSNKLNNALGEREQKIEELSSEVNDMQGEREQLKAILQDMKDQNNEVEKRLIEQTMMKESVQKELEKQERYIEDIKSQLQVLDQQNQNTKETSDTIKESLLIANEQIKQHELDNQRLSDSNIAHQEKISSLKLKQSTLKLQIKTLIEEKSSVEGKNENLQSQVIQMSEECQKRQLDIENLSKQNELLQDKLREDQKTLQSNKGMIEFLNKQLNEAQRLSFRTIVNSKSRVEGFGPGESISMAPQMPSLGGMRMNTVSPLRVSSAGMPRFDMVKSFEKNPSYSITNAQPLRPHNLPKPAYSKHQPDDVQKQFSDEPGPSSTLQDYHSTLNQLQAHLQTTQEATLYRPQPSLNLPLTDFYLNKHQSSSGHLHPKPQHFSHQLEHDRIISEDKLKQRFDEAYKHQQQHHHYGGINNHYQSKYQAGFIVSQPKENNNTNNSVKQNLYKEEFMNNNQIQHEMSLKVLHVEEIVQDNQMSNEDDM